MHKIIKYISITAIAVLLTACSHQNPLNTKEHKDVGRFLADASQYAEKSLKIESYPPGAEYGLCMQGVRDPAFCAALYQKMVEYAKTQPEFSKLTLQDLTDHKTWLALKDNYVAADFDKI